MIGDVGLVRDGSTSNLLCIRHNKGYDDSDGDSFCFFLCLSPSFYVALSTSLIQEIIKTGMSTDECSDVS